MADQMISEKEISNAIMPVISYNYSSFLSWDGYGEIDDDEYQKLKKLVQDTHAQQKELRLWAIPDHENAWKFLLDNGMDLINTDHIKSSEHLLWNTNLPVIESNYLKLN